jgi:hypothetical protein
VTWSAVVSRQAASPPVVHWYTVAGWQLARQPGTEDAWRLLFVGAHVGWVLRSPAGWRYRVDDAVRFTESPLLYSSWGKAAAAAALSAVARRVVGRLVPADGWIRAQGHPWTPAVRGAS